MATLTERSDSNLSSVYSSFVDRNATPLIQLREEEAGIDRSNNMDWVPNRERRNSV